MRSRNLRWTAGTAVLCLAVLAASWLLLIGPRRATASSLRDQNTSAVSENDQLQIKLAQLRAQFAALPATKAELAAIQRQLPPGRDLSGLVTDLNTLAGASGVVLTSVTPNNAQPLSAVARGAATGRSGGPAEVVVIPISVVVRGGYLQTALFLSKVQTQLSRAFLVLGLQMVTSAGSGAGTVDTTITGRVFTLPATGS